MKKVILLFSIIFAINTNAQEGLKAGVHLGFPLLDASDVTSFNFGLDAAYLINVLDDNLYVGPATGFTYFTGRSDIYIYDVDGVRRVTKGSGVGFIPLAGTAKYNFTDQFFAGVDIGLGLPTGGGGLGFYFQPKGGWQNEVFETFVSLKGVTRSGGTFGVFGIGAAYKFNL